MTSSIVQIGPYRGRCVASGGFADVYYVPDSPHGCPVAVKWSHASCNSPEQESMAHEFALLSEFHHRRLPRAHAFGWEDQRPYLVLDWIEGESLWGFQSASAEDSIVVALRELARAMTFVHSRGWVHGDLKPDNLLWGIPRAGGSGVTDSIARTPLLYLMDFGLARTIGDKDRPRGAGTMGYTAPEFLRRQPADGRADWYSAGVILYEWVYGQRPFASNEPAVEVEGHLERSPDFKRTMVRPAPDWIREVAARLLAKEPDERGTNVIELLTWMSQFDSSLHPDLILNELLDDQRRSEDRRLSFSDAQLLSQIIESHDAPATLSWAVSADDFTAERLTRGLICSSARTGDEFAITRTATESADAAARGSLRAAMSPVGAPAGESVRVSLHVPSSAHEPRNAVAENTSVAGVTCLPWNKQAVAEYLEGLTNDNRFSNRWSARIWEITGGLPAAVSGLLEFLIADGHLHRLDGQWELDDTALAVWQKSQSAASAFAEAIGDLTPDERRMIEWFALGRSFMQIDLLGELLQISPERLRDTFHGLRSRGIVVPRSNCRSFFDWRLRLHGLAAFWRLQLPAQMQRRLSSQLASALENCSIQNDMRVTEVMAECFADAQRWDKCVHYAVTIVAARLKENQPEAALPFVALAAEAAQQIPEGKSKSYWLGRALMARGDYQEACGQIGDALRTFRELLVFGRRAGDRRLLAETLKDLGSLYRLTRRFEKGVRVLRRARQLWEQIGDRAEVARTLNNLGNMYWVASDREEARRYYLEGLQIARTLGEDQIVANILSNLGVTYKCDYDFARAESYYRDSLAIKERLDLPAEIALTLNNLGVIAFDQGRLLEADHHFRRAIDLNDGVGAEAESVFTRGNLIQVILERGDLRTAITAGDAAIRDADALGDVPTSAELRGFMAEAYQRAGDFQTSRSYLEAARNLATGQKNYDLEGHLGLVEAFRCLRLGLGSPVNDILDGIDHAIAHAEMPRLRLDAAMIRVTTAVALGENDVADEWWGRGREMAKMFSMPHKLAQLAFSRLPADPQMGFPSEARAQAEEFLQASDDRWHWAASFKLWAALAAMTSGEWADAERFASEGIEQLRMDGNWETLWRGLEIYGHIHYKRSDYEPALSAFNEAETILSEILKTIEDEDERRAYSEHPQACSLAHVRRRIVELVS